MNKKKLLIFQWQFLPLATASTAAVGCAPVGCSSSWLNCARNVAAAAAVDSSSSSLLMLLGNCIANGIKETVDWLCRSAGDPLDVPPPPPLLLLRVQSSADTNDRPRSYHSRCLVGWLVGWMQSVIIELVDGDERGSEHQEDGTTHARRRRRVCRRRLLIYESCVYGFTRRHSKRSRI